MKKTKRIILICTILIFSIFLVACNSEPAHTCTYDQQVTSAEFIKTEATCNNEAEYFFSCKCGKTSETFFKYGEKLSHDKEYHQAQAPTCTEIGWEAYETCKRDGCNYTTYKEIPASHAIEYHEAQAPTCTEIGWEAYETCKRDGCNYTTYKELSALNHDKEYHNAQAPTCTEIGWEAYETCKRDGCNYTTYNELSATGEHTWDEGNITTEPTCTENGIKTFTCTVCKNTTKTEAVDKLPHNHSTDWESNGTYHWFECKCGNKKGEEKHTAGAPATATTPQTCTVCGYVLQEETGILFNTLTENGTKVYGKVSNTMTEFSFIDEVTVKGNATYIVDDNKDCGSPIKSKTVDLEIGDNTFYVLESIGNDVKLFTVTIRRRMMYNVTFNVDGGIAVEKQIIEEDHLATEPKTTRIGYTFMGWDYNFTEPITQNTCITASWIVNKDTEYTVNYYWQNIEDNEYTLHESVVLAGETDTTATADIKEYAHFTYNANMSTINGNINGDGSCVLSVYYTRNSYKIVVNANNSKAGVCTEINGTYKYDKEFTLTVTTNAGYTWLGWYEGENLICKSEEFMFKAEKDVAYTASWIVNKDIEYTVNYYWQNIEDNEYTLHESVVLAGETDTTATADIKEYAHFTYNASMSTINGNINGDGSCVLSVYYTRNSYTLSVDNSSYGAITNSGNYKYGKEITSIAAPYLGYDFVGWYSGEMLLSNDLTYIFVAEQNVKANFAVKEEMSNFIFSSTTKTCSITGIKDKTVTSIEIPDSVTSIGNYAFENCDNLTIIEIPDSVTSIGNSAFENCSSLTSVVIGDSVTSIGRSAFENCSSLTSITIPFVGATKDGTSNTHFGYIFGASSYSYNSNYVPTSLKIVKITGGTSIGSYAFSGCSSITSVVIGDSVTSIGSYTFYDCSSLTSVEIPASVTSIGSYTFYDCSSLTSVETPASVTSIGEYAFYYCSSLTSVYYTGSIDQWVEIEFSNYYSNPLYYANNLYIDEKLVTEVKLTTATKINAYAFSGCSSITSIEIPDSVTSIGSYVFAYCSSLTSIEIPDSVTSIGECAFRNCSSLTSIEIPDSVTSIGSSAFYNCSSLTNIEIGNSVTSIGK
ncbi:MAG: leucine-rich repeat protein, partial [Clostridia bacterium]|nr:leucine-rich repeat protein [Clostridia bacterium]